MEGLNHSERGHSKLGASSSERWMKCTGSNALIDSLNLPKDEGSEYSKEGTAAHELADYCLVNAVDAKILVNGKSKFNGYTPTSEMAEAVQVYLDYIRSKQSDFAEIFVEEEFSLDFIDPTMFGTNDCAIVDTGESLEIVDYKHGQGQEVFAVNNSQLLYYALGAYRKFELEGKVKKIVLTIVQPRIFSGDKIKSWTITEKRLLEFEKELRDIVHNKINVGDVELKSGDHCKWCRAKAHCPKLREEAMEIAKVAFDEEAITGKDLTPPDIMSPEQMVKILENGETIKKWIDSVFSFAKNQLEMGKEVKGYKLVEGRSNRKFTSEEDIIDAFGEKFGDKLYKKSLIGITDMEKLVGKKSLEPFTFKPKGASTMVPASDKRPAIKVSASQMFDELETNQDVLDLEF